MADDEWCIKVLSAMGVDIFQNFLGFSGIGEEPVCMESSKTY